MHINVLKIIFNLYCKAVKYRKILLPLSLDVLETNNAAQKRKFFNILKLVFSRRKLSAFYFTISE